MRILSDARRLRPNLPKTSMARKGNVSKSLLFNFLIAKTKQPMVTSVAGGNDGNRNLKFKQSRRVIVTFKWNV